MSESKEMETAELPSEVISRIEDRVRYLEFEDASEYITYVLEEVLYRVEEENDLSDAEAVDEQQVEERLKSLGYLNE